MNNTSLQNRLVISNASAKTVKKANPQTEKQSIKEHWQPVYYKQRHIATLKRITQWTDADLEQNLTHNRILQDGFLRRPASEVIHDAKVTKTDWLTDFVCVKFEHACRMYIAARLVCFYQVTPEILDQMTNAVYQQLENKISVKELDGKIESICSFDNENSDAFSRIQHDKQMQKNMNQIIHENLDVFLPNIAKALDIKEKPKKTIGENMDHIFLEAAGSGKSIIARQQLDPSHTSMAAIIATDNYRAVTFGEIDSKLSHEQSFIKTQDTAYFIKELVQKNLEQTAERPDLIIDVVTFEPWMTGLLQENPQKTVVSVACLGDASQVPLRAYQRAIDAESAPADQGRHVNTHALIEGHLKASKYLLTGLPSHHPQILLYNTNTKDRVAKKIAEIDNINHKVTINDLAQTGAFLGKQNLNPEATSKSELYYHNQINQNRFRYRIQDQAASILAMIPKQNSKQEYSLILQTENGENYATIQSNAHGELKFKVTDRALMKSELRKENNPILAELVKQTSKYKDQGRYLGERLCQKKALEDLFFDLD